MAGTPAAREGARLYYQVFDLLNIDGCDLTSRPLLERKSRLMDLLRRADASRLRYVAHTEGDDAEFLRAVDELGLEGIVCNRARRHLRRVRRAEKALDPAAKQPDIIGSNLAEVAEQIIEVDG